MWGSVHLLTQKDEPTGRTDSEAQIWVWSPRLKFHMQSLCPQSQILLSEVISSSPLLTKIFLGNCSSNIALCMSRLIARGDVTFHKSQPSKAGAAWNNEWFLEQQSTHSKVLRGAFWNKLLFQQLIFLALYHLLWGRQGAITTQFQQVALHKALTWRTCWEVICRKFLQSSLSSIICRSIHEPNKMPSTINVERTPKSNCQFKIAG